MKKHNPIYAKSRKAAKGNKDHNRKRKRVIAFIKDVIIILSLVSTILSIVSLVRNLCESNPKPKEDANRPFPPSSSLHPKKFKPSRSQESPWLLSFEKSFSITTISS